MQLLAGNERVARLAYLSDIFVRLKQLKRKNAKQEGKCPE
jgi:hypothetical protein